MTQMEKVIPPAEAPTSIQISTSSCSSSSLCQEGLGIEQDSRTIETEHDLRDVMSSDSSSSMPTAAQQTSLLRPQPQSKPPLAPEGRIECTPPLVNAPTVLPLSPPNSETLITTDFERAENHKKTKIKYSANKDNDSLPWTTGSKSGLAKIIVSSHYLNTKNMGVVRMNAASESKCGFKRKFQQQRTIMDEFRSSLKDSTAATPISPSKEYETNSNKPNIPKNIPLLCGLVKYDIHQNNWQILYRMPTVKTYDINFGTNENTTIDSYTNISPSYLSSIRTFIPSSFLLSSELSSLVSESEWKLDLNQTWFKNIYNMLRQDTKNAQIVVYLTNMTSGETPPPNHLIQAIVQRIELYTILSIAELNFSLRDKKEHSNHQSTLPFFITLRYGQLVDLSSLVVFSSNNHSKIVSQNSDSQNSFSDEKIVRILGYSKEIILSSLIQSSVKSATTDNEVQNQKGYIHPFRRAALEFVSSCLLPNDCSMDTKENIESPLICEYKSNQNKKCITVKKEFHDSGSQSEIPNKKSDPQCSKEVGENELNTPCRKMPKSKDRNREVSHITKGYTVPQTLKSNTISQLFVNDFSVLSFLSENDSSSMANSASRPKRQIKTVMRYEAKPANREDRRKTSVKIGQGFNCPRCDHWLSYDAMKCEECDLKCRYQAGHGVVVFKDRNDVTSDQVKKEITKDDLFIAKKIEPPQAKQPSTKKIEATKQHHQVSPNENTKQIFVYHKECDVCFAVLKSTYFQKHRKKVHNLPPTEMGCPYCKATFLTPEVRMAHIKSKHPNSQAYGITPISLDTKQRAIFRCYLCWNSFSLLNELSRHIKIRHNCNFEYDKVTFACPFCPQACILKPYETFNSLLDHVQTRHRGGSIEKDLLVEELCGIGCEMKSAEEARYNPDPGENINENTTKQDNSKLRRSTRASPAKSTKKELSKQWSSLNVSSLLLENDSILDFFHKDLQNDSKAPSKKIESEDEISITKLLKSLEVRLKILGGDLQSKIQSSQFRKESIEDDEYANELRLFKRGLRERSAKQEHERNDKEKYKSECESDRLVQAYMNRNKKRTKEDLELSLLETRPVRYVSTAAWKNAGFRKCDIENCCLCGLDYAHMLLLNQEMKSENSQHEVNIKRPETLTVESPYYQEISEDKILWPDDENENTLRKSRSSPSRIAKKAVYSQKVGKMEEHMRLKALKDTVIFMIRYNKGLLKNDK